MDLKTEPGVQTDAETAGGAPLSSVNRLAVGAAVSVVGVVVGRGFDFVKQIAMARLLGPDLFGLFAIGWNTLRIVDVLAPLGLQNGVVHFGTGLWRKDDGGLKSVLVRSIGLSFVIGWLITAALLALAPWITADVFNEPEFLPLFRVFALMLPFMGALRVASNATRISQRMQYSVAAEEIAQASVNLILFVILYLLGWQLLGAIVSTVLSFVAALLLALYFLRRLFAPAFAAKARPTVSTHELLVYSAPTALSGMFGVVINRFDRLFLGFYWPSSEVGIYQAAAQLSIIMALVLNAFNMILMPMIAEQFHKRDMAQLEELFRVNTKWGIYAVVPVVLVILLMPQDVMVVLFGAEYAAGATALFILTVGQFINIATGATGIILIMTGHQTAWFRLTMLVMGINIALNLLLIPRLAMVGAALATATTISGLFVVGLLIVRQVLHIWPYDRRYLKGVAAALLTAGAILALRALDLTPVVGLVISSAVSLVGFFGLLLLMGLDPEDRSFLSLLAQRIRKR